MPDSPQIPSDADRTGEERSTPIDANETVPTATAAEPNAAEPTPSATRPLPDAAPPAAAPASPSSAATQPYPAATVPPAAPAAAGSVGAAPTTTKTKRPVGLLIGALAVGAIVGGAAGGGVVAAAMSSSDRSSSTSASTPQTITVNNKDDVSTTTAVAAKAGPSVVTISVATSAESGTGSGVVLTSDGYVLTNTHVVTLDGASAAGTIEVTAANGKLYKATVVGTDPIVDLAVIKLTDASGLQPIEFGNSNNLNVGQKAIAIGAPLGLSNTVTDGIISSLNRSIQIASSAVPNSSSGDTSTPGSGSSPFNFWNFGGGSGGTGSGGSGGTTTTPTTQSAEISLPVIQTDAPINPGNSGGALLDSSGKLIGINVAIASTGSTDASSQSGSIGVGFAIPAQLAKRISGEIIKDGKGSHGLLGASVTTATSSSSSVVGALIAEVSSGGGADKAGLKKGDVVTSFNGIPITDSTDLTAQVRSLAAGSTAKVTFVRGSDSSTVSVTLGSLQL
ncbi:MAG: trypsin-like peptidase domain-containing protein [Actinomycetota bacterium]|nr:trypsin-like peptidase domain-containing protein [Actinomycetota bacterium]